MAKFINADAFKEHLKQFAEARFGEGLHGFMLACFATQIMREIDNFPASDVEEVRRGEWKEVDVYTDDGSNRSFRFINCGFCKFFIPTLYLDVKRYNYCPNCGAKMQEGKSEGNEKSE